MKMIRTNRRTPGSPSAPPAQPGPIGLSFADELADDLRSPLAAILVLAESMREGEAGPVSDAQRTQLGLITEAAEHLCSSASDLIELARAGAYLPDRLRTPFSIDDLLEEVRAMVQPVVDRAELELRVYARCPARRVGHPLALTRVLYNLASSAVRHARHGYVEIAVRERQGNPSRVEFSVRDTGEDSAVAHAPEVIGSIWHQVPQPQQCAKEGFGLAVSRKLIAAMDSTLYVETRPRWGSWCYFELELPVAPPRA